MNYAEDEWDDRIVYARDPDEAATKAAELWDQEDYSLARGNEHVVQVRAVGTTEVSRWNVTAESVPVYYANPAEEEG